MKVKLINTRHRREFLIPKELEEKIPTWYAQVLNLEGKIIFDTSEEYMAIRPVTMQWSRSTTICEIRKRRFRLRDRQYTHRLELTVPVPTRILAQYGISPLKKSQEFYVFESTYYDKQTKKHLPLYVLSLKDVKGF